MSTADKQASHTTDPPVDDAAATSAERPTAPAAAPKRGPYKQPPTKQNPWQFNGRGPSYARGDGTKPQKDAERRGGKSRKVH